MKGKKCFGLLLALPIMLGLSLSVYSEDTSAASASVSQASVSFWSSSSAQGQVSAVVNLPWTADIGGSASNRQQFYLNNISMVYPISANSDTSNIYGRLVMRFTPLFTSSEPAYFCDKKLNDFTSTSTDVLTQCIGTVIYYFADGTSYRVNSPVYMNFSLPSGALAAYVDYNQSLPSTALTQIGLYIAKTGNYDVYSTTAGYGSVLTTLVSDGSYYITSSGGTDINPLINQNNIIINQNNETNQYLSEQAQKDQEDRDNLENASQDAQTGANSSQQSATSTGTTLLGAFSAFVNALVNASPSNCNIDMDMGNLDLGVIDFCTLSLPQPFPTIASIFLILFCVPLSIATARKVISLFRSFQ